LRISGQPESEALSQQKTPVCTGVFVIPKWLRGLDLNQLPSGYEPKIYSAKQQGKHLVNTH
jgi:hypothetical protein